MLRAKRFARGFTLIELMIVIAIVAILTAVAYNSYGRYSYRTRRADGREMLMRVAAAEERFFTNFNAYSGSITTAAAAGGLGFTTANSENGNYAVAVQLTGGAAGYLLIAAPIGVQAADSCGPLTLSDTGVKLPAGTGPGNNGNCW
jgi:type IV pilus assembly protein PilE